MINNGNAKVYDILFNKNVQIGYSDRDIKILKGDGEIIVEAASPHFADQRSYITLTELREHPGKYLIFYPEFCYSEPPMAVYAADLHPNKKQGFLITSNSRYRIDRKDQEDDNGRFIFEGLGILSEMDKLTVKSGENLECSESEFYDFFRDFVRNATEGPNTNRIDFSRRNVLTAPLYVPIDEEL